MYFKYVSVHVCICACTSFCISVGKAVPELILFLLFSVLSSMWGYGRANWSETKNHKQPYTWSAVERVDVDLRSSPTFRISHSILVSSMLLRPKGHSCLSSRLLFSRTIWKHRPWDEPGQKKRGCVFFLHPTTQPVLKYELIYQSIYLALAQVCSQGALLVLTRPKTSLVTLTIIFLSAFTSWLKLVANLTLSDPLK